MSGLPILSEAVARCDLVAEVVDIWQRILERQTEGEKATAKTAPKFVVSVVQWKMKKVIGSIISPFCEEEMENQATEIILDLVSKQSVDTKSFDIDSLNGLTLASMSGKKLKFRRDPNRKGKYLLNDIEVTQIWYLKDGTVAIGINDFLFDHEKKIKEALKEMNKKPGLRNRIKAFFKRDDEKEEGNDDKKEGKDDKKEGKDDKKEGKDYKKEGNDDKKEGKEDKKERKDDKKKGNGE